MRIVKVSMSFFILGILLVSHVMSAEKQISKITVSHGFNLYGPKCL
jgi:hypothetical protein